MTDREPEAPFLRTALPDTEGLPYSVELWDRERDAAERVLGRAATAVLARAIFTAAASEHVGRRIVLLRGTEVIAQNDPSAETA